MSAELKALIWDVDGTVAETERDGHRLAFNEALREQGLAWQWDVAHYGRLLRVAGGYERLLHDMAMRPDAPQAIAERERLARAVHRRKNERYAARVASGAIALRPGVRRLMDECEAAGVALAIATTTSRANVDALFGRQFASQAGVHALDRFAAVVCAEQAPQKKPDPQAYVLALARLGIEGREALAIEDSPNGLAAARAAGVACVVTRSVYFAGDDFSAAAALCDDLDSPLTAAAFETPRTDLRALRAVHRIAWAVSKEGGAI